MSDKKNKKLISDEQAEELIKAFGSESTLTASLSEATQSASTKDSPPIAAAQPVGRPEAEVRSSGAKSSYHRPNPAAVALKLMALILAVVLLTWFLPSGNVMNLQSASLQFKDRPTFFQTSTDNLLGDVLIDIHSIPRKYILDMSDSLTPEPNSDLFIKIDDEQRKNYDGSPIDYYKDETIEVKVWKEMRQNNVFNFAEVWIEHPSQLRRTLVDNVVSKKHLDTPSNIFRRTNGIVGMSADFCAFRYFGIIVQYGKVVRTRTYEGIEDAIFDKYGNLSSCIDTKDFLTSDIMKRGDVIHTFAFGPVIVDNYQVVKSRKLRDYICQPTDPYPRAAICQYDYDKHYLLCVVEYPGLTLPDFAKEIQTTGVRFAYNLDGGQTGTLLYNKKAINAPAYGGERVVSDILYFATAVPNDEK